MVGITCGLDFSFGDPPSIVGGLGTYAENITREYVSWGMM